MDLKLQDKLAIVTGSTGDGIGNGIAKELARHGAFVIINGRSKASVDAAIDAIVDDTGAARDHLIAIEADLGSADGVSSFIERVSSVESDIGREVDILVNNLGIFHVQDFAEITDEKWMEYYNINTMSGVRLSRHFLPRMKQRNDNGRILFVSSECGLRPLGHMVAYSVSKASQLALARGLAETTKGTTVTVNSILPGPTMTGGVRKYMQDFGKEHGIDDLDEAIATYFKEHEKTSLIQRFLDVKEIGDTAAFLCSPLGSGINGSSQKVEGGIVHHI